LVKNNFLSTGADRRKPAQTGAIVLEACSRYLSNKCNNMQPAR
jgi:hypothetical protein